MKAIALTLATLLFATSVAASTPLTGADASIQEQADAQTYVLSTKNAKKKPKYAYSNPLGVGPANDSR